jgi:hypothetical protein
MEYLTFKFGFCVSRTNNDTPCVQILIDENSVIDKLYLDQAGTVDDLAATMQWVTINSTIADHVASQHTIRVQALNIDDSKKTCGDFGFQLRSVRINDVILEHFSKNSAVYNPILHSSYITDFLEPNNKLCEIEYIDNRAYHVQRGDYANYVNSKDGWFEMTFDTPLYNWLTVDNNFGAMHQWLIIRYFKK